MVITEFAKRTGRGLAVAVVGAALLTAPGSAQARVSNGAAVGIGLGSFALGAAVGSAAANPYGYPYGGYAPAPAYYYPPAPAYYAPPRNCWDPYYQRYYAC